VEPAVSPFKKQLAGAGIVEPDTENISIGSHLPGVVEQVLVKVGDTVRPGQPLFRQDERQLRSELAVRQANLSNALAALDKMNAAPRLEELPPLRAKVAEAEASLNDQQKMYDRSKKAGLASSEEELTRREAGVLMSRAMVEKARADLALTEAGAWKFDKQVAAAAVKQAEAMVEQTKTEIARLTVLAPRLQWTEGAAPTEFKVLQVNVRPGEFVGTTQGQPLIVLGHVGKLHVRVDIDENDIPRFRPNLAGKAQPRGDAATRFPITFVRVEPYVIPKRSLTGGSMERVDTRVLQVIYRIESADRPLYVGQQMDVFLDTEAQ
jgi:HlyD family secretion protein